jgi:serine/threonine-protein kinase
MDRCANVEGDMMKDPDSPVSSQDEEPRPTGDLAPGESVGQYAAVRRIARGGCGSVYDARHRTTGQRVAVKVLHAFLAEQPKMVERFLREVELVNLLRHPGIVEILEVGVLPDRRPFYAMEYLAGGTLEELLKAKGRLTPEEALDVLDPVCGALEAAHAAGIVHRDVKASNIAFDESRRVVKLLDFGIAKLLSSDAGQAGLTSVGRQLGTPTIMPPEQLLGRAVDARADVYALGVLLHRMLTGRVPFDGKSPGALARQHLEEPPPRPSRSAPVGPAIDAVVLRCLEKQPERRFASVRAFCATLAEALGRHEGGPTSSRVARARAVAVYVDLKVRVGDDDYDEAITADLGTLLDLAVERLRRYAFVLAQATGNGVLGVRLATGDTGGERRAAVTAATALAAEIAGRSGADPRVHANVVVHADDVLVRPGPSPEIAGGALLCTSAWAPEGPAPGVSATPEALEGLPDLDAALRRTGAA